MPVFALYNFDDAGLVAADSAPINGAQDGVYFEGAAPSAGRAVLDGVDDKVKIYPDTNYQLARGTLEIQFSQTAHMGDYPNTVLSRDSVGETPGGYRIEVMPDGSVLISHESATGTTTFQTDAAFVNAGDEVNVSYSWDEAAGGSLYISNLTTNATFADDVPTGLTMDQGAISQPWMIGAGQSQTDAGTVDNLQDHFNGSVEMFSLSDTVDNALAGPDGFVRGTDDANLIDGAYVDPFDTDRVDAGDAIIGDDAPDDDRIRAQAGDDTVFAGLGDDTVYAGLGNDLAYGGVGDDELRGDEGDDTLYGGDGSDTVYGDDDDDLIDTSAATPLPDIDYPGVYPADADPENDRDLVFGGLGNDTIRTGDDADTIFGDGGNDQIFSGIDADLVYGGGGDDTIVGSEGADTIFGQDGNDLIYGGLDDPIGDALDLPDAVDLRPLNNPDQVYGGAGDDTIYGRDDNDILEGGTGNDLLFGGVDDDLLRGDAGEDTLNGDEGDDTLEGGTENDLLSGGAGDDLLQGDEGDDTLNGGAGEDILQGGDGNDVLRGGTDDDFMQGGQGADTLTGDDGNDIIEGGTGNDQINGGAGIDTLYGGADRDDFTVARGEGAGDAIFGGSEGDDFDRLILQGSPSVYRLVETGPDSDGNGIDGRVEYLDGAGNVTGTLQFENIEEIVSIPCFTPGTLIATPRGEVPIDSLRAGDRIITRDNGIQELRWIGQRKFDWAHLTANPHLRPIMIRQGSLGNGLPERDMMVSPNHRVLVSNERTSLYFDEHEVLVSAKHLVGGKGVFEVDSIGTTYIHLMFDQHEVVLSDGAWTESFQPGDYTLKGMGNAQRNEILELFPELKTHEGLEDYTAARRTLKKHEAVLLVR